MRACVDAYSLGAINVNRLFHSPSLHTNPDLNHQIQPDGTSFPETDSNNNASINTPTGLEAPFRFALQV